MNLCVCTHTCMHMSIHTHTCAFEDRVWQSQSSGDWRHVLYAYTSLLVVICVHTYSSFCHLCVHVYIYICVCVCVCERERERERERGCVCVRPSTVQVRVFSQFCNFMGACMFICLRICVCVCVCVHVCVWERALERERERADALLHKSLLSSWIGYMLMNFHHAADMGLSLLWRPLTTLEQVSSSQAEVLSSTLWSTRPLSSAHSRGRCLMLWWPRWTRSVWWSLWDQSMVLGNQATWWITCMIIFFLS